jgi:hypothetical protein
MRLFSGNRYIAAVESLICNSIPETFEVQRMCIAGIGPLITQI